MTPDDIVRFGGNGHTSESLCKARRELNALVADLPTREGSFSLAEIFGVDRFPPKEHPVFTYEAAVEHRRLSREIVDKSRMFVLQGGNTFDKITSGSVSDRHQ